MPHTKKDKYNGEALRTDEPRGMINHKNPKTIATIISPNIVDKNFPIIKSN